MQSFYPSDIPLSTSCQRTVLMRTVCTALLMAACIGLSGCRPAAGPTPPSVPSPAPLPATPVPATFLPASDSPVGPEAPAVSSALSQLIPTATPAAPTYVVMAHFPADWQLGAPISVDELVNTTGDIAWATELIAALDSRLVRVAMPTTVNVNGYTPRVLLANVPRDNLTLATYLPLIAEQLMEDERVIPDPPTIDYTLRAGDAPVGLLQYAQRDAAAGADLLGMLVVVPDAENDIFMLMAGSANAAGAVAFSELLHAVTPTLSVAAPDEAIAGR